MDAVKSFNQELSSLYEVKPPISKAKMTALTRGAIKAIKFYKHVVQSVEKFILKCRPEYKVPGLYVIDSIVRQSRHQFGSDKDVFAPRFSKNMQQTFINLFKCPPEDKSKIIRVLNLWQKNNVFPPEVIQPLFDLADPNNPIYKELGTPVQQTNGLSVPAAAMVKGSPAMQRTPTKGNQPGNDSTHGSTANMNLTDPNVLQQLQQLQRLLTKNTEVARAEPVHFDKKLLDFDYGDDDEEVNPSPRPQQPNANDSVSSLLANPEVLRQLQTLQQTMANAQQQEMDMDKMRKLQEMKQQEEEFDKHLAQTVPNLPFAAECEFKPNNNNTQIMPTASSYYDNMNPPAVNYQSVNYEIHQQQVLKTNVEINNSGVEVITLDHDDSRSDSEERYSKRRRSRSRSRDRRGRDRDRDRDRKKRSRSRSTSRRHRSRSRDRKQKEKEKEKDSERDRERKKRGLPAIKKDHLSICSTTLWVGHLSKLVHQDDLSNTFGEFGDVVSIDLIPPRGCAFIVMLRRQDAARCLAKLKGHVLHGKAITLAWAPGKGVKGKDLKDYWEGDLGVSYIPFSKIKEDIDIEMLEDGGMIDEETMPDWMREKVDRMGKKVNLEMPPMLLGTEGTQIDTSQPPPMPGAGLLQAPPPLLPIVSPFQFNNRLLGMNVPPGMMPNIPNMPNIPLGVPPPNMTGAMMPNQLLGIGSPFQGPPTMMPPPQLNPMDNKPTPPNADANLHSLSESLMNLTQSFGMIPPAGPPPLQQHQDDNMDVEMEDAEKPVEKDRSNSEGGYRSGRDDRKDNRRDDRDRRNKSRERERDRDRDRDKDRGRDRRNSRDRERDRRDSRGRDRDRDRDRRDDRDKRDRGNRWSDRDRSRDRRDNREGREPDNRDERKDREKSLNDRLREMAGMGNYEDRDRNKDRERRDQALRFQPPERVAEDYGRTSGKNEFGFPRGQSVEKSDKVDVPGEVKAAADLSQDNSRDMLPDVPNSAVLTQNFQLELEGSQDVDSGIDGPPDMDRQLNDLMDPRSRRGPSNLLDVMGAPLNMMEAPPHFMGGPPPHMMNRPPSMEDPRSVDRPPHMMMDRPPHLMDRPHPMLDRPLLDGPPPYMMEDIPPEMLDGPPDMYFDRMDRRDIEGGRFRGGPPRGGFFPRGMRGGPPPSDFEYYDNFPRDGPRGPMRGSPNFGPRGGRMMGPRGQRMPFFRGGPRGGRGGFRDGPNFNPRFDGPPDDFYRGPGGPRMRPPLFNDGPPMFNDGPPMFNDGPPMFNDGPQRFRGHRFEDRNWDRQEDDYEEHAPSQSGRQGRRSRWGNHDGDDEQVPGEDDFNKRATTPVFDECPPQEEGGYDQIQRDNEESYQQHDEGAGERVHQDESGAGGNDNSEQYQNEGGNAENFESSGDNDCQGTSDQIEGGDDNYQENEGNFQDTGNHGDGGGDGVGDDTQTNVNECNDAGAGEEGNVAADNGNEGEAGEPATE